MNNINTSPPQLNDVLNGLMKPENSNVIENDRKSSEKVENQSLPVEITEIDKVEPLSKVQLEELAVKLQEFVGDLDKSLKFETHQESGRDVIKVLDGESGDLIKQFPSEELLGIITNLSKASGLLVNEKI
ncbi:flagellar protein FlaG [Pseudoalteromonas sp. C2R02]|uniref:flagellar protein FlaG n=1 Tax=Pseudoalteromonas sp. C2R02 TaxID=2841565 RepID=UPI001C088A52|nr:flagellar protein FlaG [Pseudoalteromonas sp. C2R02]MBU2968995.1 flagellar protein FlaG [Pseudoalteromonas sp. C2R02]